MSRSTVSINKMKSTASELDGIYTMMTNNMKKLNELIASLTKVWAGEGAGAYVRAYTENSNDFALMAEAIKGCSSTLSTTAATYSKADTAAADAIKSKMAKG